MIKTQSAPLISVVVPTRANNFPQLKLLFSALAEQTLQDFELLLVCDRKFSEAERNEFHQFITQQSLPASKIRLFSHCNSDFLPHSKGGASYVRNYGISQASGEFIQLFDDDNIFDPHYLQTALNLYKKFQKADSEAVITPTLMRKDTDLIQNQGFSGYNYRLARPQIHFLAPDQEWGEIQMFSGNGVFARAELMQKVRYDEEIARIAEDLDFVYRLRKAGARIFVFSDLKVQHWEREKNALEQARIWTPQSAQQKIQNIFRRVKKHANLSQTLLFICRSSRGIVLWLSLKSLLLAKDGRLALLAGLWKGYLSWWKRFLTK